MAKSKISVSEKTFKENVEATPDISKYYEKGLSALGIHSKKIEISNTNKCCGSVDLDTCTTYLYPQASRWDYIFCYNNEVFFIEVHSANTSEVKTVIKKLHWLKQWLSESAPEINKMRAKIQPFIWIQSNNFRIPKNSSQYLQAIQEGIKPIPKIVLKD